MQLHETEVCVCYKERYIWLSVMNRACNGRADIIYIIPVFHSDRYWRIQFAEVGIQWHSRLLLQVGKGQTDIRTQADTQTYVGR